MSTEPRYTIKQLQVKIFHWVEKQNWHNKSRLEYIALICGEVGEAVNEARGIGVGEKYYMELADIAIRLFDLAEVEGIVLQDYIEKKMNINLTRDFSGKHK